MRVRIGLQAPKTSRVISHSIALYDRSIAMRARTPSCTESGRNEKTIESTALLPLKSQLASVRPIVCE